MGELRSLERQEVRVPRAVPVSADTSPEIDGASGLRNSTLHPRISRPGATPALPVHWALVRCRRDLNP